ncbi:hypothetical protein FS837_000488 [Tulasnella sp. UAMH 9824]|nr:hypothetical protein FS837_000488 [Tulasnella sp. UAMH 9824]
MSGYRSGNPFGVRDKSGKVGKGKRRTPSSTPKTPEAGLVDSRKEKQDKRYQVLASSR